MARATPHIDMRVIKTKQAIRSALAKLMAERDISLISVSDVARVAMVNKKTFLAHYASVYAVLEEMETSALSSLEEAVGSVDVLVDRSRLTHALRSLGTLASDRTGDLGCLLSSRVRDELLSKVRVRLGDEFSSRMRSGEKKVGYTIDFVAGGIVSVLSQWADSGFAGSVDDVASVVESFTREALSSFPAAQDTRQRSL